MLESAGFDTFAGEIDGDKLYGRGTSDMKSGEAVIALWRFAWQKFLSAKIELSE